MPKRHVQVCRRVKAVDGAHRPLTYVHGDIQEAVSNSPTGAAMTEAEAKTKWCPMAVTWPHYKTRPINREAQGFVPNECLCVGSACMMWRWFERPEFVWDRASIDMSDPEKIVSTQEKKKNTDPPIGYCGLAGKP